MKNKKIELKNLTEKYEMQFVKLKELVHFHENKSLLNQSKKINRHGKEKN